MKTSFSSALPRAFVAGVICEPDGFTSLNGDALSVNDAASLSDTTIETGSIEQVLGVGIFDDTAILAGGVDDASGTASLTDNNTAASNRSVDNLAGTGVSVQTVDSVENVSNAAQDMTVGGATGGVPALAPTLALNAQLPFPNNPFPSSGPIDSNEWHYNTGDSSFIVKTQFRPELPNATNGVMQLNFNTWNPSDPTNSTFFGSEAISGSTQDQPLMFNPNRDGPLRFIAEARYEPNLDGTIQRGIIGGFMFLYSDSGDPNTHDEIDFEGMSNFPTQIQTNIYHNEPPGNGHPISYPFSPDSTLATFHKYEIDWFTNKVVWKVDDQAVRTVTDPNLVPTQDMALHFNIWTGAADWPTSDPSTQPTDASNDHRYTIDVKSVHVEKITLVGEPALSVVDIQNDQLAIIRTPLSLDQASALLNSINSGTVSEFQYINNLLAQATNSTIPAIAVEATMYGAVGTSAEVDFLVNEFLPLQEANAIKLGLNALVYDSETLALAFAFGNETGSTAFLSNFGPTNAFLPNTAAGDAAFTSAAVNAIFGSAATANLETAMNGWVANWKAFYTANGIPSIASPNADQIDLAARAAAWGDAVGVALDNLGPLKGQAINFLMDAAEGIAGYSMSLVGQPAHHPFQGEIS